jgi:hypothetical protein
MVSGKRVLSLVIVAAVASVAIAGCAGGGAMSGTVVAIQPGDMAKLAGTWQGTMTATSGASVPATLTVNRDGTYTSRGGAYASAGKAQLKDGKVDFVTTYTSGGQAVDDRSGSAVLMDRGDSWGLVGSGRADAGPFNFDFSKTK